MFKHFNSTRAEWKHLFTNKILLISSIVMFAIPILYGGFFLGSIWDPYGNTSKLPVAVVNEDKAVTYNGQTLQIGNDVVSSLKENHDLKWEFVSADKAKEGLDSGYYYMSITLPRDFSKNATTVTADTPEESTLLYTVTPSKNYVGSLISEQAADKVVTNVKQTITHEYVQAMLASVEELKGGMAQASSGASQLATGSQTLASGVGSYTQGVATVASGQASLQNGIVQLQTGLQSVSAGLGAVNNGLPTEAQLTALEAGVTQVQAGINLLNSTATKPPAGSTGAATAKSAGDVIKAITQYQTLAATKSAADSNKTALEVVTASAQAGSTTTTVQTADIQAVLVVVKQGVTLAQKSGALLENIQQLNKELAASTQQLATGMNALSPQLVATINGYTTVRNANSQLLGGTNQLVQGTNQLLMGSQALTAGTNTLVANSAQLTQGSSELAGGSATLAYKLSDASDQLAMQPTGSATVDHIVSPVKDSKTIKGEVPNYGFALSPYVLALGLYVGALVFTVIYPVRSRFGKPTSGFDWFVAKFGTATVVGTGQVAVLAAVMVGVLGLHPVDPFGFIMLLLVSSFTFMSITTFLAVAFDNPGRFVAMLLLVLQLGGAEGVFPVETLPKFFQVINPYLPMTYSIHGLREAISGSVGGQTVLGNVLIVVLFGIVAQLLLYITLSIHHHQPFKRTTVVAE